MPRTKYRPEVDGYAFTNTWKWEPTDIATITGIVTDALGAVEVALSPLIAIAEAPVFAAELAVPFIGPWLVAKTIEAENKAIINGIVGAITVGTYGLCGGMAFSSLDYWHKSLVVPRGNGKDDQPQDGTPQGTALREYIWNRLLRSVKDNIWTFLEWMAILHFGGADGGANLRDKTKAQLVTLRNIINGGTPVTVGLIGTTWNPLDNHQILIYGFEDNPDGTTTLFAYDNNFPSMETTIKLHFGGPTLQADESDASPDRGPLRGLFCTTYTPATPPLADVLSHGLTVTPAVTGAGKPVKVAITATNVGFHNSPAFQLVVAGDNGSAVKDPAAASIPAAGSRSLTGDLSFTGLGNHKIATVVTFPPFGGMTLSRFLPAQTSADNPDGSVVIIGERQINPVTDAVCEVVNVQGGKAWYSVDVSDMGTGLKFQWTVSGATLLSAATEQMVQVQLPAQPGVNYTLGVTVTRPDGGMASGSETFQTLSQLAAGLAHAICEIGHIMTQPPFQLPGGDPGPDQGIIVDPEQIAALATVAQGLTTAANAAAASLKAGGQLVISVPSRTNATNVAGVANVANVANATNIANTTNIANATNIGSVVAPLAGVARTTQPG
jgi:hypothetical protein